MSAEARVEGPAYCLHHHHVLLIPARPSCPEPSCPECVLDQEFPAPYPDALYSELLPPELQEAAKGFHRSNRRALALFRANDPDVPRGRKVRESIVKRDAARPKRTAADIKAIENQVRALHKNWPLLSWTRVCEIVGESLEPELTSHRVRDLARGARWAK